MTLTVSGLYCYPLKSARGLSLDVAEVEPRGLRDDRRWMVVDPQGEFISQRDLPKMARIAVALVEDGLLLSSDGAGEVFAPRGGMGRTKVRVWGDEVVAETCSALADKWLSELLGEACRLVYMPDYTRREISQSYAKPGEIVGFADGFPLLLIGRGSLDALNEKLAEPVPMNRFRPNIVVSGAEPHAEDGWSQIRVGGLEMAVVKPCSRCPMPGVDQLTGERSREPLATLARYRRKDGQVWFGQNVIAREFGVIRAGDAVAVELSSTFKPDFS
jgi:hypothetical protein